MDKRSVDLYEQRNAVTLTVKMGADRNKASYLRIVACKIALEPAPTQYSWEFSLVNVGAELICFFRAPSIQLLALSTETWQMLVCQFT